MNTNKLTAFKTLLGLVLVLSQLTRLYAQAPGITYPVSSYTFYQNRPVIAVVPTNSGGVVPAQVAGQSTTVQSGFSNPFGIAIASNGDYIITEAITGVVKRISGGTVTTVATGLSTPYGCAVAPNGDIYVAENSGGRISKISGGVRTTAIGSMIAPTSVAVAANGDVYAVDANANQIKVLSGGTVATFYSGLSGPRGITVDAQDNVYVSEYLSGKIYKIPISTGVAALVTTLSPGYAAELTVDPNNNVYVMMVAGTPRRITASGSVSTLSGSFGGAWAMAFEASTGNLVAPDYGTGEVRTVSVYGYSISPALAAGLNFSGNGTISGTPTALRTATSHTITATNASGSATTTLTIAVAANNAPAITGIAPLRAAPGSSVTITGQGFNATAANNIVLFAGIPAVVTSASTTSLTVTVPQGVPYGTVRVLNTATKLQAQSTQFFSPVFTPIKANIHSYDFAGTATITANPYSYGMAIADLDGSGKPDVYLGTGNAGGAQSAFIRNIASAGTLNASSFATPVITGSAGSTSSAVSGDMDGDGKPDLLVGGAYSLSFHRNAATSSSFTTSSFNRYDLYSAKGDVALADLDGDGKLDALAFDGGNLWVLRNLVTAPGDFTASSFASPVLLATPASGTYFRGLAVQDFNGDGRPDIVVSSTATANNLMLITNQAAAGTLTTGSFAAPVYMTVGSQLNKAATGDLDNDGFADLIVQSTGSTNGLYVLRNRGTGSALGASAFETPVLLSNTGSFININLGDFDGDGAVDLFSAWSSVSIMRSRITAPGSFTTTSFSAPVSVSISGTTITGAVAVDMDGDGIPDLAASGYNGSYQGQLGLLRNQPLLPPAISSFSPASAGAGATLTISGSGFTGATGVTINSGAVQSFTVVNDNQITAVVAAANTSGLITVTHPLTGSANSSTAFTMLPPTLTASSSMAAFSYAIGSQQAPQSFTVSGVDLRGNITVAAPTGLQVSTAAGGPWSGSLSLVPVSGTVSSQQVYVRVSPSASTGSLTGNFVVSSTAATTVNIAVPAGSVVTAAQPLVVSALSAIGGMGGSSQITITGTGFNTTAANNLVFFGGVQATVNSATATTLSVSVPTGAQYAPVTVLNTATGLSGTSPRAFSPTFTPGKGMITAADIEPKHDVASHVNVFFGAMGDIDGDGKLDIVSSNVSSGIEVYRNTTSGTGSFGSGTFAAKVMFTAGTTPYGVSLADVDGDGKLDILVANSGTNDVSVLRNTSTGPGPITSSSFAAAVNFATDLMSRTVVARDMDGDGRPDLVVGNYAYGTVSVLRNTISAPGPITSSSFAARVNFTAGSAVFAAVVQDMDGDGKPDIITANQASNNVSVLRNTATPGTITSSSFATAVNFAANNWPYDVQAGDVDGDGKPEIIVSHNGGGSGNTVSVYRNTISAPGTLSSGSFATKVDYTVGTAPYNVKLGDLDGDGKPDIVVANNGGNGISVLRNAISSAGALSASSFEPKLDIATNTQPTEVLLGDIDGDSRMDIAVSNRGNYSLSLLRNNPRPQITAAGPLTALTTTAGTASGSTSFTVSGQLMQAAVAISAPAHIELSADNNTFSASLSIPASGTLASTTVYVRIPASAPPGAITGNIVLTSTNANTVNLPLASGTQANAIVPAIGALALPATTFGDPAFNITDPTTNGGGAFSYTSSNASVATINGNQVTIVSAGNTTITATQAASGNYASGSVQANLTVSPAVPAISVIPTTPIGVVYGAATQSLQPSSANTVGAYTYATSDASVASVNSSGVISFGNVGNATLTISQAAAGNYAAASRTVAVTVTAATPVISVAANPVNAIYGAAAQNLQATSASNGTYTYSSSNSAVASVDAQGQISITGAGSATITISQAAAGNYAAATLPVPVTVTQAAPNIGALSLPTVTYGDPAFALTDPASNSGGAFTYTSSNTSVAQVSGNTVTIVGAGTATITATQAATTNYTNGTVSGTLTVAQAAPVITQPAALQKVMGSGTFQLADPASTGTGGWSWTTGNPQVATVSGNTVTLTGLGTATLTATQAATANYTAGSTSLVLTVVSSNPGLAGFSVPAKTYGDAPYVLTDPTSNSQGGFTYTSSDLSVATINGNQVTIVGAGNAVITATQAAWSYYPSGTISAALVVARANPTVAQPAGIAKVYGDVAFTLPAPQSNSNGAWSYVSSNSSVATTSGNTATIAGAGTTTITATQAATANYNSGSTSFTLTVVPAQPIVGSFVAINKTYGDPAFQLSAPTSNNPSAWNYTSSNPAVVAINGNGVTVLGAGQATITASQAATANYMAATATTTITVAKANPVLLPPQAIGKVYGDAAFTLVAPQSSSPGAWGYTSANTGIATISGNTVTIVGAGTTTITATQSATANYNGGSTSFALIVAPAPAAAGMLAPINKVYGDAPFALAAPQSASPAAWSYSSSNPAVASISGNTVTVVGAGQATITASQPATANYMAATVTTVITVAKANPSVAAVASVNKVYGDAAFTWIAPQSNSNGMWSYTSDNNSVVGVSGNTATITGAGSATITATQAATANYNAASVSTTFTVAKATPMIAALPALNRIYGDASFTIAPPHSSSPEAFSFSSSNPAVATITGNRINITGAGTTTITASQPAGANYLGGSVQAVLTVNPAPLTITVKNAYRCVGYTNPQWSYTTSGFVNGENASVLTAQPQLSTAATTASVAGNYAINASGAQAANYSISYVSGTLQVNNPQHQPQRLPVVDAIAGERTPLSARMFGTTYQWSPATGLSNDRVALTTTTLTDEVTYQVATTEATGCVVTDTLQVRVYNKPDVFVPTLFSPNGDGVNETLCNNAVGLRQIYYWRVFDRQGRLLFETRSHNMCWDGRYKGQLQPMGTYQWILLAQDKGGKTIGRSGSVTLVR